MGYFKTAYNLSDGATGFDYIGFGFFVVLSPIGVPLYWIGVVAAYIMEELR